MGDYIMVLPAPWLTTYSDKLAARRGSTKCRGPLVRVDGVGRCESVAEPGSLVEML